MTAQASFAEAQESYYVLGETLRPMLTNAMGSAVEIFDTKGPANAGPPPHSHAWEEIYIVLSGELEVTVAGKTSHLTAGGYAHVPANTPHGYRNVTEAHFLTIVTRGNAATLFKKLSSEIAMDPPDLEGIQRIAATQGVKFYL